MPDCMRHTFCVSHWFGGRAVVRSCIYRGCTSIRPGVVFLCESLLFLPLRHGTGFNPMSLSGLSHRCGIAYRGFTLCVSRGVVRASVQRSGLGCPPPCTRAESARLPPHAPDSVVLFGWSILSRSKVPLLWSYQRCTELMRKAHLGAHSYASGCCSLTLVSPASRPVRG